MPIFQAKPTSPGRRFVTRIKHEDIHKGDPEKSLLDTKARTGGRNNLGRITQRHRGGGHKQKYRIIDFKRDKDNVPGRVERLEYDPNRTSLIALVVYKDGEKRYIIAPKGLKKGMPVISGRDAPIKTGSALPINNIPLGTVIHCVEMKPGKGAQIARSAGASAELISKEGSWAKVRLRSGVIYMIPVTCRASIGEVGNAEHNLRSLGKAGAVRWRGRRPHVRGVAMNPIDHPHGGGEGRTSAGRHPVSFSGVPTKGYKTRKNKRTTKFIVRSRHGK